MYIIKINKDIYIKIKNILQLGFEHNCEFKKVNFLLDTPQLPISQNNLVCYNKNIII